MKTTVIYHYADFDGIFCREIACHFLPDAELIGWDYKDAKIPFPAEGRVYVLDLSPDCFDTSYTDESNARLIWIDHHKTAIDKFWSSIPGYRIDGVAACRLAWQWFCTWKANGRGERGHWEEALPVKQSYIDRTVSEPLAVRLAGEYDIWDKRDPRAETFQFGLRSKDLTSEDWEWLLTVRDGTKQGEYELAKTNAIVMELMEDGKLLQKYQQRNDALAMNSSFVMEWEGLKFLALNTQAKSSLAFASRDVPETGHDALLKFSFNGKVWDFSMYHARHNMGIDLSEIAKKHGGGGHRGACGFRLNTLPFA